MAASHNIPWGPELPRGQNYPTLPYMTKSLTDFSLSAYTVTGIFQVKPSKRIYEETDFFWLGGRGVVLSYDKII